jgi:hypothetical protein
MFAEEVFYAGLQSSKEFGNVEGEVFVGYLGEWDSNTGWSDNWLVEGGGANKGSHRGLEGGAAGNGSGAEGMIFVPAGRYGGGVIGKSSVGAYVGTPANGPGVGAGGYINIMPNATCSAIRAQNSHKGTGSGDTF